MINKMNLIFLVVVITLILLPAAIVKWGAIAFGSFIYLVYRQTQA